MTKETYWSNVKYIEITEKRYNHVKSAFKYFCLGNHDKKHYYLARNRKTLDDKLEEQQGGRR